MNMAAIPRCWKRACNALPGIQLRLIPRNRYDDGDSTTNWTRCLSQKPKQGLPKTSRQCPVSFYRHLGGEMVIGTGSGGSQDESGTRDAERGMQNEESNSFCIPHSDFCIHFHPQCPWAGSPRVFFSSVNFSSSICGFFASRFNRSSGSVLLLRTLNHQSLSSTVMPSR
jgi:hypothetical protein